MRTERNKGVMALVALAFIFASMGVFVRYLQTDFTILQQTFLRITAAFFLGVIIFYKDLDFGKLKLLPLKEWLILLFRSVALYLIAVTLISQAYTTAKYGNVSFVSALPLTAVLGFALLKEKVTIRKVLYILLGFSGVVLIAVKDYTNIFSWSFGEVLAIVSSFFFSLSYISRKWQTNLLNNKEIAVLMFFISAILLFMTSLVIDDGLPSVSLSSNLIIPVILVAGLFNVVNLFLINYGFQKVEAVPASNLLMLEVVFAVGLAIFLYGEFPTTKELVGGLLIVVSAYQTNKLS